jgi:hypothetical protein
MNENWVVLVAIAGIVIITVCGIIGERFGDKCESVQIERN